MSGFFERFWSCYPRKIGKGNAEKSWNKLTPAEPLFNQIILAVDAQIRHRHKIEELNRNAKHERYHKFIPDWPHPATWLNQQRWLDEIPSIVEAKVEIEKDAEYCPKCNEKGKMEKEIEHMNNKEHLCSWHFSEKHYQKELIGLKVLRERWKQLNIQKLSGESWRDAISRTYPKLINKYQSKIEQD